MRKLVIIVLSLAMMMSIATPASAVPNPGPPDLPGPYANYLNAVAKDIGHVGTKLNALFLAHPPDPGAPLPKAFINRLGAITNQLDELHGRLVRNNPGPITDPAVIAALVAIRSGAEGILASVDGAPIPEPAPPEINDALLDVIIGAEAIILQCDTLLGGG